MTLSAPESVARPPVPASPAAERDAALDRAATQFEGLLLQELVKVMRRATQTPSTGGGLYGDMFEGAFAESLAAGGGIGFGSMIAESLGGGASSPAPLGTPPQALRPWAWTPGPVSAVATGAGQTASLQDAAHAMLVDGPARWGRDGALVPRDLAGAGTADALGPRIDLRAVNGYAGHPKCNLFAFELARRAGFGVPVVRHPGGEGFPAANRVASDAADGALAAGWGRVVTGESGTDIDAGIRNGQRAFMLAGAGRGERHGHMAVVERVHQVDYGADGRVDRVVFDGWEARAKGAEHLERRTWNRHGNPGGTNVRGGFEHIQLIELNRTATAGSSSAPDRPHLHVEAAP